MADHETSSTYIGAPGGPLALPPVAASNALGTSVLSCSPQSSAPPPYPTTPVPAKTRGTAPLPPSPGFFTRIKPGLSAANGRTRARQLVVFLVYLFSIVLLTIPLGLGLYPKVDRNVSAIAVLEVYLYVFMGLGVALALAVANCVARMTSPSRRSLGQREVELVDRTGLGVV
ncbi:hypothetical protein C8A01DRAFT_34752 [Parachaetomium inaequale]|uniref:Uncharacterized protein n=1 Tax=Parachaetomium inaequale TaxID=2588326 RepID=A0AAN6PHZ8_9PEZI|nr:hypothetical protein C8A01DRAFT_34752 [Parachaetomium inaequale]